MSTPIKLSDLSLHNNVVTNYNLHYPILFLQYEHLVLLELLKKGRTESDKKIGGGIQAFQVRYHPMWKSRCFFLVRNDGSSDDFSFRKCVDHILPLPENMKVHSSSDGNKKFGGHNKGGGRGGGRGGRGGRGRGRGGFRK